MLTDNHGLRPIDRMTLAAIKSVTPQPASAVAILTAMHWHFPRFEFSWTQFISSVAHLRERGMIRVADNEDDHPAGFEFRVGLTEAGNALAHDTSDLRARSLAEETRDAALREIGL